MIANRTMDSERVGLLARFLQEAHGCPSAEPCFDGIYEEPGFQYMRVDVLTSSICLFGSPGVGNGCRRNAKWKNQLTVCTSIYPKLA